MCQCINKVSKELKDILLRFELVQDSCSDICGVELKLQHALELSHSQTSVSTLASQQGDDRTPSAFYG